VTEPLYVFGENSEGYSTVNELKVIHFELLNKSKCHGREEEGWPYTCEDPIEIPIGSRMMLSSVGESDLQLLNYLRNYICHRCSRHGISINAYKRFSLREVGGGPTRHSTRTTSQSPISSLRSRFTSYSRALRKLLCISCAQRIFAVYAPCVRLKSQQLQVHILRRKCKHRAKQAKTLVT
jgi:hypothetical protein